MLGDLRFALWVTLAIAAAACNDAGGNRDTPPRTYPYVDTVDAARGFAFDVEDPRFDEVIDVASAITILAGGFDWSEGPLWVEDGRRLLFTDVPGNVVYRYDPDRVTMRRDEGIWGVDTFMYPSGFLADPAISGEPGANGLLLDTDGGLLLAQHGERQLVGFRQNLQAVLDQRRYLRPDSAAFAPLATNYHGRKLNSPNDLTRATDGTLYFTDPPYGVDKTFGEAARELDFSGVYRVNRDSVDRSATLLYRGLDRPNGIVLTPDETALIVSNSQNERMVWMRCPLKPLGDTTELDCTVFADLTERVGEANPGSADGMYMLGSGLLLATGPGGVLLFDEDGTELGTIRTGRPTANVTVGGRDGRDIFITADDLLLEVRLK